MSRTLYLALVVLAAALLLVLLVAGATLAAALGTSVLGVALAAALMALAAGAGALRVAAFRELLHYDPAVDRVADLRAKGAHTQPVVIAGREFPWPASSKFWDTALLKLQLQCRFVGRLCDPWIETRCGHCAVRQYFERGLAGTRYLDLTGLRPALSGDAVTITLHCDGVQIAAPDAELLLFHDGPQESSRVLVIAPHPDDAEIAAFGLYSGHHSTIVTVTAGDAPSNPFPLLAGGDSRSLRAALRAWESITVPTLAGVPSERCVNLGYPDGRLAEMYDAHERGGPPTSFPRRSRTSDPVSAVAADQGTDARWPDLVADLAALVDSARPDILVVPHPVIDGHPDHAFCCVALSAALARLPDVQPNWFLYVVHPVATEAYPFGPTGAAAGLPPALTPIEVDAVVSCPLSSARRQLKFFALEAMCDMRLPSDGSAAAPAPRAMLRSAISRPYHALTGLGNHYTNFFRRAVRSNELFLAARPETARQLVAQFLAGRGRPGNPSDRSR